MKTLNTNWSYEELKAYLVLYCFSLDYSKINKAMKHSMLNISKATFESLIAEFSEDNDYQSIQKIYAYLEKNQFSQTQLDKLFKDIKKQVVLSGRKCNYLMKNIFFGLERTILNAA